jgi:hypothetical protein
MSFRISACEHLAQYKVGILGIQEDGIFHHSGRHILKTHILPIAHRDKNILERYRVQFFSSEYFELKLHQFFHHLNSSQALCINLFYPLIVDNALGLFLKFLDIAPEGDLRALFEKESDIEVAARRTSFDFYVQLAVHSNIFVEVKYTEDGFGRAKIDEEHRTKFLKTYLPLVENSRFLMPGCQEVKFFLSHYQILRNLVHISDTSHVVLLFPSANTAVAKEAGYARNHLLTEAGRAMLKIVFLDDFVSFLENQCMGSPLDGYYQSFRTKYLPRNMSKGMDAERVKHCIGTPNKYHRDMINGAK